jgi:hypothetical protein
VGEHFFWDTLYTLKATLYIRCSHFKVDDVSALEYSPKPQVRIVEDNVTSSLYQQPRHDPGYGLDAVTP